MKRLAILGVLVVAACSYPEQHENTVIWKFETQQQLTQRGVGGYANLSSEPGGICTITTERPTNIRDQWLYEVIIHELRHCREGAFH